MDEMNYQSGMAALFAGHVRTLKADDWLERLAGWLWATPTKKQERRSQHTLEAYLRDARLFAEWFAKVNQEAFAPELLNSQDVKAYFDQQRAEAKPATFNRKLAAMRMLVKWAQESGLINYDPTQWIAYLEYQRESPKDLRDDEWQALVEAAEKRAGSRYGAEERAYSTTGTGDLIGLRDLALFRLMGSAGLRIHEALGLKLSDLRLDKGLIHVLGKGKKERNVKVGGRLVEVLREWLERGPKSLEGTVITDLEGHAIGREQGWKRFDLIRTAANVPDATPHTLRHSYVYRYMEAYMAGDKARLPQAIKAVCLQTGDTPEVILEYYTGARESDMRAVAEVM